MRAVVHGLHGQGQRAGLEPFQEEGRDLAHGKDGVQAACEVRLIEPVTLFGDGEGNHLQGRIPEDILQAVPVLELAVRLQRFGDARDHLFSHGPVAAEGNQQGKVVVRLVGLVDDLEIEGLGHDDAAVVLARVQGVVQDGGREGAEDVTAAEMDPGRFGEGLFAEGLDVETGNFVAFPFPLGGLEGAAQDICQFHVGQSKNPGCL